MACFPVPGVADRILDAYFVSGGIPQDQPFKLTPMPHLSAGDAFFELTVLANFVEVFLAKQGHSGAVGVNYLEKLQIPTLPSLYGALLARVDYVLMGAGVPRFIPGVLDRLACGEIAELRIEIEGSSAGELPVCRFDPTRLFGGRAPQLRRPAFLAIVSSATLAATLARKSNGRVDGFVIEGAAAGGHNAPPRGPLQLTVHGEPVYGPRDVVDLEMVRELGLPFWLAGGYAHPDKLTEALSSGANGIQVGTAFAFCEESGIAEGLKSRVLELSRMGSIKVFTDPAASPTGFPFKVLQMAGTLSEPAVGKSRARHTCDLGYLRRCYFRADGSVGYRCPAEPEEQYIAKGGRASDTVGRMCVCNALFATIGLGQVDGDGLVEPALVTAGDDVVNLLRFLGEGRKSYSAGDVIQYLLDERDDKKTAGDAAEKCQRTPQVHVVCDVDSLVPRGGTMKRIVVDTFGGPEVMRFEEAPLPSPGHGEVRVRITSIGMNHADLMARSGNYRLSSGSPPFTPGIEGGGIIDAVGPGVSATRKNERVILGLGFRRNRDDGGTYRTHYVCAEEEAIPAPAAIPDDQLGAIWLPYLTAWGCLVWKQQMKPGDYVALPAASSSVALAAAQIVRQQGGIAIGMTTNSQKVERIRALHSCAYDHLVVTKSGPGRQPWYNDLKRITRGHGVDIFFDPVGAGVYLDTEIRSLAQRGSIYIYGLLGKPGQVDVQPLIRKYANLRGWLLNELAESRDALLRGYREVLGGFASGVFTQHVAGVYKLAQASVAHEFMERGEHVGKLVLVP